MSIEIAHTHTTADDNVTKTYVDVVVTAGSYYVDCIRDAVYYQITLTKWDIVDDHQSLTLNDVKF